MTKEALATGKSIHDITVIERGRITQQKWEEIFSVENLIHPKFINS